LFHHSSMMITNVKENFARISTYSFAMVLHRGMVSECLWYQFYCCFNNHEWIQSN